MLKGELRHFQIALVGYWLDARPYPADGLAVSRKTTPNFVRTNDGCTSDGFSPPAILDAETLNNRAVIRSTSGVAMIRVGIDVNCRDVWAIAEFIDGRQHDLFMDPGVMLARKLAFARACKAW